MDVVVGFSVTMTGTSSVVMENGEGLGSVDDSEDERETLVAVAGVLTAGVEVITVDCVAVTEDVDGEGILIVVVVEDGVVDNGVLAAAGEGLAGLSATPVSVGEDESLAVTILWS